MRRVRRTASGHNPADPQPHDGRAREAICCVGADKDIWSKIKATDFQDASEEPALEDWLQHAGAPATAVAIHEAHTRGLLLRATAAAYLCAAASSGDSVFHRITGT